MKERGPERRLELSAAKAIVAQADILSSLGGESRDSRLPAARQLLSERATAHEAAQTATAARRSKRFDIGPLNPLIIREFCGPCDYYLRGSDQCLLFPLSQQARISRGSCVGARINGRIGIMTKDGFSSPDQLIY